MRRGWWLLLAVGCSFSVTGTGEAGNASGGSEGSSSGASATSQGTSDSATTSAGTSGPSSTSSDDGASTGSIQPGDCAATPARSHAVPLGIVQERVSATAERMPLLVDLSILDAEFWSRVQPDGGDLVATDSTGTRLPLEVVSIDVDSSAGELWVATKVTERSKAVIQLHFGADGSAAQPDPEEPTGRHAVWSDDYVAVWHLTESAEGADDDFLDSTSAEHFGQGGRGEPDRYPTRVTDAPFGQYAQDFEQTEEDFISVPYDSDFDLTTAITVEGWGKWESFDAGGSGNTSVLVKRDSYRLSADRDSGEPKSDISGSSVTGPEPVKLDQWQHLAMTYDGQRHAVMLDGAEVAGEPFTGSSEINDRNIELGSHGLNGAFMDGILDEIRISSVARSSKYLRMQFVMMSDNAGFWDVGDVIACDEL